MKDKKHVKVLVGCRFSEFSAESREILCKLLLSPNDVTVEWDRRDLYRKFENMHGQSFDGKPITKKKVFEETYYSDYESFSNSWRMTCIINNTCFDYRLDIDVTDELVAKMSKQLERLCWLYFKWVSKKISKYECPSESVFNKKLDKLIMKSLDVSKK